VFKIQIVREAAQLVIQRNSGTIAFSGFFVKKQNP
jgi:hypothetical protein